MAKRIGAVVASLIVAILLLAAAGLLGACVYVQSAAFSERLATRLSETLGREVAFASPLDVSLAWPPRITLHGLTIVAPDWAARPHFLELQTLVLSVAPASWTRLALSLDLVRASGGSLFMASGPDGATTWPQPQGDGGSQWIEIDSLAGARIKDVLIRAADGPRLQVDKLTVEDAGADRLKLVLNGQLRGRSLQTQWTVPDITEMWASDKALRVQIEHFQWGRRDVTGALTLKRAVQPMRLAGELHSNRWPLTQQDDETKNGEAAGIGGAHLFPAVPIPTAWRGLLDADVRWQIDSVPAGVLTLTNLTVALRIAGDSLILDPLRFELDNAAADTRLTIDIPKQTPSVAYAGRITGIDLSQTIGPLLEGLEDTGHAATAFDVYGTGDDTRRVLTHINGDLRLVLEQGQIKTALLDRIAVSLGRLLGLASKVEGATPVRCLALRATADNGLVTIQDFILDTAQAVFTASGTINLRTGAISVSLNPSSQGLNLTELQAPIDIRGSLSNPTAQLDASGFVAETLTGTVTALLGLSGPLAGLLGDPGDGKGCSATLRQFQS